MTQMTENIYRVSTSQRCDLIMFSPIFISDYVLVQVKQNSTLSNIADIIGLAARPKISSEVVK